MNRGLSKGMIFLATLVLVAGSAFAGNVCKITDTKCLPPGEYCCPTGDSCCPLGEAGAAHSRAVNLAINGMTCTSCEGLISGALEKIDGVIKIHNLSYKTGKALICINASEVNNEALITAVTNKGYEAEIIPAVAKSTAVAGDRLSSLKRGCSKTCPSAKVCPSSKAKSAKADAGETK